MLWDKLAVLAPIALATSALDAPLGTAREDPRLAGCREEALAVAGAEGAHVDGDAVRTFHAGGPASMRRSMQKDLEAGREPELDAIAGPILRGGRQHGLPTESTQQLADQIRSRLTRPGSDPGLTPL